MADETIEPKKTGGNDVEDNKFMAVLAYVGILFLIPLLAAKDSAFAKYHTKQGIVLFIADVILSFIWVIPILGWLVGFVGGIFLFILFIMGIINASSGKQVPLPVIGKFADKINI